MAASIQASEIGLQLVEQARKKKGWNKKAHAWCIAADNVSPSTLDRFWAKTLISQKNFVAICKAVGIEAWKEIADFSDTPLLSPHTPTSSPPEFSAYSEEIWVGREAVVDDLVSKLQEKTRLLWITGISGIGKTTLGECLASQAWERAPSFQWIYLEILAGQSADFASVAADLLAKLGDRDLDPQERNNPEQLAKRLLQKMQSHFYWIQMDSLERLLQPEQPTEFADAYWKTFLERCLTEANLASRLVLTAQAFPTVLVEFSDRYPNAWAEIRLPGLSQVDKQLEFFAKRGVVVAPNIQDILTTIARTYEGHPLVLKVIAEDILQEFAGDVDRYWQIYQPEFEQVSRELQATRLDETEYNEALDRKVRERIKRSLEQLPADALDLLCRSAVFRRPVPKKFWLAMIGELTPQQQKAAYRVLGDRTLIEKEGADIRQHNLIRSVAYDHLQSDFLTWESVERKAAHIWITTYKPVLNVPNLEAVRGYLEAFYHYCEIEDWKRASEIYMQRLETTNQDLHWQLFVWGNYQELIQISVRLAGEVSSVSSSTRIRCLLNLGNVNVYTGNQDKAIEWYKNALTIAQETGDRESEGKTLGNLGVAHKELRQYERAIDFYQQRLIIAREVGDRRGECNVLGNMGLAHHKLEQYEQAISYHQQALFISKEIGSGDNEGCDLENLGAAFLNLERYEEAFEVLQKALKIDKKSGFRAGEAETLKLLADLYQAWGQSEMAQQHYQEALALARELGIPLAAECELKIREEGSDSREED